MGKKLDTDLAATGQSSFRIGLKGGGQRSLELFNGFVGRFLWNPTANRDIVIPDQAGTVPLINASGNIGGVSASTANGEVLVHQQKGQLLSLPYSTTFSSTDRVTAWVPDHPSGAGSYTWNGSAWSTQSSGSAPDAMAFGDTAKRFYIWPAGSTTLTAVGIWLTTSGTISHPTQNSTSVLNRSTRAQLASTATAGNVITLRGTNNRIWRGLSAGQGGFKISIPFGLSAIQASQRGFFGISSSSANATNVDPTISTTDAKLGVGFNSNTGNYQLITGNNATAPTFTDLGSNFPIDITTWYELLISCAANGSSYNYELINRSTGFTTGSQQISVNIPANTFYMGPYLWMTNNLTAAAVSLLFGAITCEYNI